MPPEINQVVKKLQEKGFSLNLSFGKAAFENPNDRWCLCYTIQKGDGEEFGRGCPFDDENPDFVGALASLFETVEKSIQVAEEKISSAA